MLLPAPHNRDPLTLHLRILQTLIHNQRINSPRLRSLEPAEFTPLTGKAPGTIMFEVRIVR